MGPSRQKNLGISRPFDSRAEFLCLVISIPVLHAAEAFAAQFAQDVSLDE